MNRSVFLYPTYINHSNNSGVFGYVSYSDKLDIITLKDLNFSIYLFVDTKHEQTFKDYFNASILEYIKLDNNEQIITRRFENKYTLVNNNSPISNIFSASNVGFCQKTILYTLSLSSMINFKQLIHAIKFFHLKFPFFNMIIPSSLEMNIHLSKIFESSRSDMKLSSLDLDNYKNILNVTPLYDIGKFNNIETLYKPTNIFNCCMNKNDVVQFICDDENDFILLLLKHIPKIYISICDKNGGYEDELQFIFICISCFNGKKNENEDFYMILWNTFDGEITCSWTDVGFHIIQFKNERDMLLKFYSLYSIGEMFHQFKFNGLHWITMDQDVVYRIFDRLILTCVDEISVTSFKISNEHVLLSNKGFFQKANQFKFTRDGLSIMEYMSHLVNPCSIDVKSTTVLINLDDKFAIKPHFIKLYSDIKFVLQTPLKFILDLVYFSKQAIKEIEYENLLFMSRELITSIDNVGLLSPMNISRLLIFNYFLNQGTIMTETLTTSFGITYESDFIKDAPLGLVSLVDNVYETYGGFIYTKPGIYTDDHVCIDFSSFYPSIISKFKLSFNTAFIIKGEALKYAFIKESFFESFLNFYGYIFDYEEYVQCDVKSLIDSRFYVVLFDDGPLQKMRGLNLPSLYGLFNKYMGLYRKTNNVMYKRIINYVCGCLGSPSFKYYAPHVYNIITFLGRRIIKYATYIVDCISRDINVDLGFIEFNGFSNTPERIISINTDGMVVSIDKHKEKSVLRHLNNKLLNLEKFKDTDNLNCRITNRFSSSIYINKCEYINIEDERVKQKLIQNIEDKLILKVLNDIQSFEKFEYKLEDIRNYWKLLFLYFKKMCDSEDKFISVEEAKKNIINNTNTFESFLCIISRLDDEVFDTILSGKISSVEKSLPKDLYELLLYIIK